MAGRPDSRIAGAPARSEEMNPDVFLTIAFVLWAVAGVAAVGLLVARSGRDTVLDEAVESRLNGGIADRHRRR